MMVRWTRTAAALKTQLVVYRWSSFRDGVEPQRIRIVVQVQGCDMRFPRVAMLARTGRCLSGPTGDTASISICPKTETEI
jgi:hypothetical protein